MADWQKPGISDLYQDFMNYLKSRDEDAIKWLDGASPANLPSSAKRWNSSINRFEKWDGASWSILAATYAINVDQVDGYDVGNVSGRIPLSNGTVNANLNADLLDGYHAGNGSGAVPVSNGTVNTNLNADLLDGYHAGNGSGAVPISNGTANANLNADLVDGYHASSFVLKENGSAGVYRLWRRDGTDYSLQHHWTGSHWFLRGYNSSDGFHAEVRVGYADSAGSASSATSATNATNATNATYASYVNNDTYNARFHWNGQGGQPTWLWGSNNGSDYYVWNPSNFSVNYAASAGSASSASYATSAGSAGSVAWGNVSGRPSNSRTAIVTTECSLGQWNAMGAGNVNYPFVISVNYSTGYGDWSTLVGIDIARYADNGDIYILPSNANGAGNVISVNVTLYRVELA